MSGIQILPKVEAIQPPKVINNYWSGLGASAIVSNFDESGVIFNGKKYTPSLTATTLTTLLSVTGSGQIDLLYFMENTAGPKTVRIKVTLDGTVIFDQTSASVTKGTSQGNQGAVVLGIVGGVFNGTYIRTYIAGAQPIIFNSSLLIEVQSSTTDAYTDFYVSHRTN